MKEERAKSKWGRTEKKREEKQEKWETRNESRGGKAEEEKRGVKTGAEVDE